MKGAIIGDIIGSVYEGHNIFTKDFDLFGDYNCFTDDSVMTCAVAQALMHPDRNVVKIFQETARRYPHAGYGPKFIRWIFADDPQPYNSCGNGSAMRISPVGLFGKNIEEVRTLAREMTMVSHDHIEGVRGAECTAVCVFLAKQEKTKEEIKKYVQSEYYPLDKTCMQYRLNNMIKYGGITCQETVPEAIQCFLESEDFEDCIRTAVSIGGDSDTIAAIAGGIAEAYYGIPDDIWDIAKGHLSFDLLGIVNNFYKTIKEREK